jgi:hypothetical protein
MQDGQGSARVELGGLTFEVGPHALLHVDESRWLARFAGSSGGSPALRLELRADAPAGFGLGDLPDAQPAQVEAQGDGLLVRHRLFCAELRPRQGRGWLHRTRPPLGLSIALRVAQAALLPLHGALPLHAAGLDLDGAGLACFGLSGAGKSTLAGLAPGPVFSDELVVVGGRPPLLRASGFWGELGEGRPAAPVPLAALFELDKQPGLELRRLPAAEAFRRLLPVTLVPPQAEAWRAALDVLGQLLRDVPAWRLGWTPAQPPWGALRSLLGEQPREARP